MVDRFRRSDSSRRRFFNLFPLTWCGSDGPVDTPGIFPGMGHPWPCGLMCLYRERRKGCPAAPGFGTQTVHHFFLFSAWASADSVLLTWSFQFLTNFLLALLCFRTVGGWKRSVYLSLII